MTSRWVIAFDLDGTLVDTPTGIVAAFTEVFAAMGVEPREPAAIRATIGLPLEPAFGRLLGGAADDSFVGEAIARYRAVFRELVLPQAETLLFPGVPSGLDTLRADGCTLAVATSKSRASAEALLTAAGIRDRFDLLLGADSVTRPKPDPEMGHVVMRTFGVPAERAVMVGDTTHDLLMAKAAGMRSIAVTYGIHGEAELAAAEPTWIAATFDHVVKLIQKEVGADEEYGSAAG